MWEIDENIFISSSALYHTKHDYTCACSLDNLFTKYCLHEIIFFFNAFFLFHIGLPVLPPPPPATKKKILVGKEDRKKMLLKVGNSFIMGNKSYQ